MLGQERLHLSDNTLINSIRFIFLGFGSLIILKEIFSVRGKRRSRSRNDSGKSPATKKAETSLRALEIPPCDDDKANDQGRCADPNLRCYLAKVCLKNRQN